MDVALGDTIILSTQKRLQPSSQPGFSPTRLLIQTGYHPSFQKISTGWEAGIQGLVLLILFLAATIGNEKDSSWGLFQRYFLSQLPSGGGKHKEDHLQGATASFVTSNIPGSIPVLWRESFTWRLAQRISMQPDYLHTRLSQLINQHLYAFFAF